MNGEDAFRYEMGITRPSDIDAERLLAGVAERNGHNLDEVRLFLRAVTDAVPEQPDPVVGAELVPRMAWKALSARREAEAAAEATVVRTDAATDNPPRPAPRTWARLALAGRLAVAVGLLVIAMAGLAVAGVKLPGPVTAVFSDLGLNLPNQGKADTGGAVPPGSSVEVHQRVLDQRAKRDANRRGNAIGHSRGKAIGLHEGVPPGLDGIPNGPPAHSKGGGKGAGQGQGSGQRQEGQERQGANGRFSSAPGRLHSRSPQGPRNG